MNPFHKRKLDHIISKLEHHYEVADKLWDEIQALEDCMFDLEQQYDEAIATMGTNDQYYLSFATNVEFENGRIIHKGRRIEN